ncbi:MAG: hypothetical protein C4320_06455 [Armatimonadota bacterium]
MRLLPTTYSFARFSLPSQGRVGLVLNPPRATWLRIFVYFGARNYEMYRNFTDADVLTMLSILHEFTAETSQIYNAYGNKASGKSLAEQEKSSFLNRKSVESAHYGGLLSMEAAADHLMVFADSFAEPDKTVAPWTCVRALLESYALASWFLDSTIDVKTRVGRYFAFRYIGFVQQVKLFEVQGRQQDIDKAKQRIQKVEQDALGLGFSRVVNGKGSIDGIGQKMPHMTDLVGITLNREFEYRLLSAVAHGHHWATHQMGFQKIETTNLNGQVEKGLEKHIHPKFVLYAANVAVTSFSQVLWDTWRLYGWNENEIKLFLDTTYNRLNYTNERRLWHT